MIVADAKGNELLAILNIAEENADKEYQPINHCLAVVKVGDELKSTEVIKKKLRNLLFIMRLREKKK